MNNAARQWFALRVTYARELKIKDYLDSQQIECYVPMQYEMRTRGERRRRMLVPAVHNLLFVHIDAATLRELKATDLPIRYMMDRETRRPIVIPDKQMEDFIRIVASGIEHVEVVDSQRVRFAEGDGRAGHGRAVLRRGGRLRPLQGTQQSGPFDRPDC